MNSTEFEPSCARTPNQPAHAVPALPNRTQPRCATLLRLVLLSLATLVLAVSGGKAGAQVVPELSISFRAFQYIEDGGLLRAKLRLPVPNPDR
jgi:hypothetical protein